MSVTFTRIVSDPSKMRGVPCIAGTRVPISSFLGMLAKGHSHDEVLGAYPELSAEDLNEALAYAAWRMTEQESHVH